jgi:hypothetical protein
MMFDQEIGFKLKSLDSQGANDLVICYTDRKVNVYRWYATAPNMSTSTASFAAENGNFLLQQSWESEDQVQQCFRLS